MYFSKEILLAAAGSWRAIIMKDRGCTNTTTISIRVLMHSVKGLPIQSWYHWTCLHSTAIPGDGSHYHHMFFFFFFTLLSSKQISLHLKELPQRNIPRASQVRNLDHSLAVSRLTACSSVLIYTFSTSLLLFEFTLSNWSASRSCWHS